ncbi:hypothetical protein AJ79_07860 [Helicocarpus griseus UAMH5409]|uniref:NmrA-like domain-containing protein n=1 Tax=Helicocarpus griseus UAMH5409 TaxID=1447875 RepID=A0A2B7WYP0_9EURO|nr:hypothetical protein AJ79_07860 [Helicocarpus griseus UAMH5409]
MAPQLVVVIGATGAQGGSIVAELLKSPEKYKIRGLTRDLSKPAAKALAAQGVDMQQASLSGGRDTLIKVFAGANIIFGMTDFWSSGSGAVEVAQGIAIADASAATPTLSHFIWSALPDPVKMSQGKYLNVHHWKSKSDVMEYIKSRQPSLWKKTTTILFPNYFENCLTIPEKYLPNNISGVYILRFPHSPDTPMPNVSISDTGKVIRTVVENGKKYFESSIAFYSQSLSESEKLTALGNALNIPTQYQQITSEEFQQELIESGMTSELALDFTEQLLIFEDFGNVYAQHGFIQANDIPGVSLKTWREFIQEADLMAAMQKVSTERSGAILHSSA